MKPVYLACLYILLVQPLSIPDGHCASRYPKIDTSSYKMIWNDEFNGSTLDQSKWNYEVNGDGGGNNELEYYTSLPGNSYMDNGSLVIQANHESYMEKTILPPVSPQKENLILSTAVWTFGLFFLTEEEFGQDCGCSPLKIFTAAGLKVGRSILWNS